MHRSLALVSMIAIPACLGITGAALSQELSAHHEKQPSADAYDTERYSDWQREFENLVFEVRERYPESYSWAEFGDDRLSGTVAFLGLVPNGSLELVSSVPGVSTATTGTYLEKDRDQHRTALVEATERVLGREIPWSAGWDESSRSFFVRYDEAMKGAPAAPEASALIKAAANIPEQFPVVIQSNDDAPLAFQDLRAGYRIWKDQVFQCSSAFPVKKTSGPEIGLLTAGHCPGAGISYGGPISAAYFTVLPYSQITDAATNGGDFRWLWSNTMFDGYTDLGSLGARKFTSSGAVIMGSSVCKYGTVTAYGCGSVTSLVSANIELPPESGGGFRLVSPELCSDNLTGGATSGGDSGGPWF